MKFIVEMIIFVEVADTRLRRVPPAGEPPLGTGSKTIIIQSSSDEEKDPIAIKFKDDEVLGAAEEAEVEIKIKEA